MADDVTRIFKSEMIGEPQIQKVLRNRVQGVNGELVDISPVPRDDGSEWGSETGQRNILTSQQRTDEYLYNYEHIRSLYETSGSGISTSTVGYSEAYMQYQFNYDMRFRFDYIAPVQIKKGDVTVRLYYDRYSRSGEYSYLDPSTFWVLGTSLVVINWTIDNNQSFSKNIPLNTELSRPSFDDTIPANPQFFDLDIDNLIIDKFSIAFGFSYNNTEQGVLKAIYAYAAATGLTTATVDVNIIQPKYIEIIIRGDTVRITPQAWQIGNAENSISIAQNTLLTTKAIYRSTDGTTIPLHQFLANRIIPEWDNGKQITNLTKVINDNKDVERKGTSVKIINARETAFIDDSQSFSKHKDGTARIFEIDSGEVIYDGSLQQRLDISEKTD